MKLSELFEQNGFDLGNLKESFGLIDGISEHIISESDEVLAKQHQISENIYFLIKGKATFTKYFETKSITFGFFDGVLDLIIDLFFFDLFFTVYKY